MYFTTLIFIWMFLTVAALESDPGFHLRDSGGFETFKLGIKPSDKKCHNFCSLMSELCRNGGSCIMNDDTCVATCVCAQGWSGRWCRDPVSMVTPSSRSHFLDDNGTELDTDRSKLVIPKRDTPSAGSVTRFTSSKFNVPTEKMIEPESMALNQNVSISAKDNAAGAEDVTKCLESCTDGDCISKNDQYICTRRIHASKIKGPKECQPGFVCKHGVCDVDTKDKGLKCLCEPNYIGTFCEMECPFDCGEHGVCDFHVDDNEMKCFCQWNYTGLNCTELIPLPPEDEPITFHWYVVGISVSIVAVVLAVLAFIPYWMWKRRLVFILKIVHYFQQYEEDDGREYDAFISYKSTPADEKFVLQHLYPKLETELKFKLCLHFRDFMPGEAIANNIVKAIENSRRTIMVLSPAYVTSEWCRMEYQKAQHEMLKLKHRIIPIVLEDISDCKNIDRNLRGILNSVTYIEWPGEESSKRLDRFWKKIQLSLPKKSSVGNGSSSNLHSSASAPAVLTSSAENQMDSEIQQKPDDNVKNDVNGSSESLSDAASVDSDRRSPKFRKNKKKDLKHFMGKLVHGKLFVRQDSTSSQTTLVDEETGYPRGSYDSMSESMFTESTDSACSTPVTAHTYLEENSEENAFFCGKTYYDLDSLEEISKETKNIACEKDHCDFSTCTSCSTQQTDIDQPSDKNDSDSVSDLIAAEKVSCRKCKLMKEGADNNIVKVSPIEGSDMLKIQKVSGERNLCDKCSEKIELTHTESEKRRKDEENMKLLRQTKRTWSLSHRRSASLKGITLNVRDLPRTSNNDSCHEVFVDICENI